MEKYTITVDLKKLNRDRIKKTEVNGVEQSNYSFEVVPLKEIKILKEADTWVLQKVAFVTDAPTKEERADKIKMPILGDAIQITNKRTSAPIEATKQAIRNDFKSTLTPEQSRITNEARTAHNKKVENWNAPNDGANFDVDEGINGDSIPF